jgi:hypothetical protein
MARRSAVAFLALSMACAHEHRLVPAAGAALEPGNPRVAEVTAEGVRLRIDSSAWRAGRVRDALSPVLIRLQNGSGRPLRVAYSQFTLSTADGFRIQALPPFQVAVQNASSAVVPDYAWSGFWLAPWQARFYQPGLPIWPGPLAYDPAYYSGWVGAWPPALPDQDVLRRALPEGVVDAGGKVSGFLYFPDQPRGRALTFSASLVDARTNEVFGTIEIPFTVK